MVTMNDVVAFVEKAMKENLKVDMKKFVCGISVEDKIEFSQWEDQLYICTPQGQIYIDNITNREILEFELLKEKVSEYEAKRGLEYFNNFFSEDSAHLIDINDLDNEDD